MLGGAHMKEAELSVVDLRDADLRGATVTERQLALARQLRGALLPDGSRFS